MCKRLCFPCRDPVACSFIRQYCAAVCFGSGLSAQSWKPDSCCLQWLQIGQEMGTQWPLAIVFNCLMLESKGQVRVCDSPSKKTLLPFWIPVDIFAPERNDCLDQQRLVVSANDSPRANTHPALSDTYSHSRSFSSRFPSQWKFHTVKRYTIREQACEGWGGGERSGASQWKDERYSDSCFYASFSLKKEGLVIFSPSGSYSQNQLYKWI